MTGFDGTVAVTRRPIQPTYEVVVEMSENEARELLADLGPIITKPDSAVRRLYLRLHLELVEKPAWLP